MVRKEREGHPPIKKKQGTTKTQKVICTRWWNDIEPQDARLHITYPPVSKHYKTEAHLSQAGWDAWLEFTIKMGKEEG
jgi:hypothetical protein